MSSSSSSSDAPCRQAIELSAAHFATHTSLTLNSSKLTDVLQLLVNGYNAHEAQIAELQAQVKLLSGGQMGGNHSVSRVTQQLQSIIVPVEVTLAPLATAHTPVSTSTAPPASPGAFPPALPPPSVTITEPHSPSSVDPPSLSTPVPLIVPQPTTPVVPTSNATRKEFSSPPPRSASPSAKMPTAGARTTSAGELDKLKQHVAQLQQLIGVHTDAGKEAMRQFMFAVGMSADPQQPASAAYKPLLQLPVFAVIAQHILEDSAPDTFLRGFEARLDLLTTTVEAIAQQQQQALAGGGAGTNAMRKSTNTAQRSPAVSSALATLTSSSPGATGAAGAGAVDAAARVDIARVAKDLKSLQHDIVQLKATSTELMADRKKRPSHSVTSDTSDSEEEKAAPTDPAQLVKIAKRLDVLERLVKRGGVSGNSTPTGASSSLLSPQTGAPHGTRFSLGGSGPASSVKKAMEASQSLAASQVQPAPPAVDYLAAIHAVEEKAMIANRKLKDSLTASLGSQVEALKRDVSRHDEWIIGHDAVHDDLVPTLISRASFVVAGSAGLGDSSRQSPKRPTSAMLNNVYSPFVPKRDAILRAGAQNPRNHSSTARVVDPYNSATPATAAASTLAQQQRPQSASSGRINKSSVTYKLFQQQQQHANVGYSGSSPIAAAGSADGVAFTTRPPSAALFMTSPQTPGIAPAGHSAENCVVWDCGWCNASRDVRPQWSGSPTPPHR